ncbi:cytochrome c1 [Altererythrobacter sp. CC-YST694]|uniref:cytochrome c1 n=1 Tax=Altererythrobacter sp. CC-YST694 TaxID=2755038 RepID=UPI001D01FEC7|nr:cytochrome c1 [Altererythrobacter sp. CC-YST694]MCB5425285.1 cytochrome c1 [Altererythrobacter sp. CC-YST694]
MNRLIASVAVGLFFVLSALAAFVSGAYTAITEPAAETVEHAFHKTPKELHLASDGPFGRFDKQQLQRGFQVYSEVCSACHSLKYVAFRDLEQLGYNEAEVKAIAASKQVPGVDPNTGEANTRPGLPTDYFPSPYPNDIAARAANNNAVPPDLSLMAKARHEGPAYVYSLLTGFTSQPKALLERFPDAKTPEGLHYNPYFANLNLAMAPPLTDGQVTFADGSPNTVDAMSKDLAAFLVWTAEPSLDKRKQTGWPVLGFLLFATVLSYLAYRNIWAEKKAKH